MASLAKKGPFFVANCALLVRVAPTPITFAERRSVLQVLEQYGAVEVFQRRPGRNNNFISVTKAPATATRLTAVSPVTYRIPIPPTTFDARNMDIGGPRSIENELAPTAVKSNADVDGADEQASTGIEVAQETKQFTLHMFPLSVEDHAQYMVRSPLRKPWPRSQSNHASVVSSVLNQSLPPDLVNTGFGEWLQDFGDVQAVTNGEDRIQALQFTPSWIQGSASAKRE